jgi:hypothetical protein
MKTFCRLKKIFDTYTIDENLRVNYEVARKFFDVSHVENQIEYRLFDFDDQQIRDQFHEYLLTRR